ncbi:MAG: glycosyltransferase [Patescibacteria group bacterium]|nr:glycosyltransferase [Patescibacteria group bacterium]
MLQERLQEGGVGQKKAAVWERPESVASAWEIQRAAGFRTEPQLSASSRLRSVRESLREIITPRKAIGVQRFEHGEKPQGIEALSIVIPTLNEQFYIPRLLNSLVRQNFSGDLQIIVVDGKSDDDTVGTVQKFQDRLPIEIVSAERNIGHQRNVGAELARNKHLLFIDADITLPPNTLNVLASSVNPEERIVDNVVLLPYPLKFLDTIVVLAGNTVLSVVNKYEPAMIGAFILTTKENHDKVGGFKEGAIIGEDLDYALRSVKDGAKNHMHLDVHAYNSTRRGDKMGRVRAVLLWVKAYFYVRKHGPIYSNFDYPYGDYRKK